MIGISPADARSEKTAAVQPATPSLTRTQRIGPSSGLTQPRLTRMGEMSQLSPIRAVILSCNGQEHGVGSSDRIETLNVQTELPS
jgi:hypothetical protein